MPQERGYPVNMYRLLIIPVFALAVLAYAPSQAEGDTPSTPCAELTQRDGALVGESEDEAACSGAPTIQQKAKDAAVWTKERVLRHLRVDVESYPQRQLSSKST